MSKRIIALLLCAVMILPVFVGCSNSSDDELNPDRGAYITMYLTKNIYDFDPANAYYNQDAVNVVSLMFDTLFTLNSKGKVEKSLAKKYTVKENQKTGEYTMEITLNETYWSNKVRLSADDVVYAWKRLVNSNNNYAAASLLYAVKNARAVKEGEVSIDDLGVEALAINLVRITFEGPTDYDQFLLNLTSVATAPLLETYVAKNADWAKKPSSMVTSGAFKLGKIKYQELLDKKGKPITAEDDYCFDENNELMSAGKFNTMEINYFYLERNTYYYRDPEGDSKITSSVKSYRILVDCTKTDEEILEDYKNGKLFYVGSIPLSLRDDAFVKENVQVSNALSTFVCYINQNAVISDGTSEGSLLFQDARVRQALSLAINRDDIAKKIVYAEAATGLVCPGVFNEGKISKQDFRTVGGNLIETQAKLTEAKALLTEAGITDPSKYSFKIKVAAYDTENVTVATMIAEDWCELGFRVTVDEVRPIVNNDILKELVGTAGEVPSDVCDDLFIEDIQRGTFEVIAFDYNAYSADAFSMLSNFAKSFSGMALDMESGTYDLVPHTTGYDSEEYNALIDAIYYLPYFASFTEEQLNDETFTFLEIYDTHEEFLAAYNAAKAIYDANGITPTTKKSEWAAQKATLLHKAEEMLLKDSPVIPVLFNKNAVLVSDDLSKVTSTYYIPAYFRKTTLKNYEAYKEALADFPKVDWSLVTE